LGRVGSRLGRTGRRARRRRFTGRESRLSTEADAAAVEVVVRERRASDVEEEATILSEAGARAAGSVSEARGGR
jgi:hypothetical protein